MNVELHELIGAVRGVRLDGSLSDDALVALSGIYSSLQTLTASVDVEGEYGESAEYERRLDTLYEICAGRCGAGYPFSRRCRMTAVLHRILTLPLRGTDPEKLRECEGLLRGLSEEWETVPEGERTGELVYGMMRCVSDLYGRLPESERESSVLYAWFRRQVGACAWLSDGSGRWDGVDVEESLSRVEMLMRNSNLFLDGSYDGLIAKSCARLSERILGDYGSPATCGAGAGRRLFVLYELLARGAEGSVRAGAETVASCAGRMLEEFACGSDEWLLCASVRVDRLCEREAAVIEERLFSRIA